MGARFREQRMEECVYPLLNFLDPFVNNHFIATNVRSEVNHETTAKVAKHTGQLQLPTGPVTLFSTHFTVNLSGITPTISLNTLRLT